MQANTLYEHLGYVYLCVQERKVCDEAWANSPNKILQMLLVLDNLMMQNQISRAANQESHARGWW